MRISAAGRADADRSMRPQPRDTGTRTHRTDEWASGIRLRRARSATKIARPRPWTVSRRVGRREPPPVPRGAAGEQKSGVGSVDQGAERREGAAEERTEIDLPRLRAWVREDFAVDLTVIDPVTAGADAAAQVWHAVASDGARYAVKWSGGGSPAGLILSARLAEQGIAGVVGPVPTRAGRWWSDRAGRRLSLVPWISHEPALGGMTRRQWVVYGELLGRTHAIEVDETLTEVLRQEDHRTHEQYAAVTRAVGRRLGVVAGDHAEPVARTVESPAASGGPDSGEPAAEYADTDSGRVRPVPEAGIAADHRRDDPLVRALAAGWRASAGLISTLLDQADALAAELRTRSTPRVVCHGDPHLGNMLVAGEDEVWLLDWDDAVLAPRELDLLFVLGGVLPFAQVTPEEQSWFFDGYGPVEIDPVRLAYHRCTRALEDLAVPAAEVLDPATKFDDEQRAEAVDIALSVVSPTGLATLTCAALRELGRVGEKAPAQAPD
ncbi:MULTISPECIES: phosphotransferase [Actinoalloteichus]|uniref:Phosphotransferase family protein n=1 Tax=Actinoalloteichus fjordicus TaxID=1612552 RepID=A0AAC9PTP5_9PSEU|nr:MULTISPECIES: phosphotransferase [Actinoalloteichus]APU16101.1 phosphotransferase family protein [Actinoalloteichus fjordicus]APU22166.1 phosphotransferase family protein [Actinoalloteichus sp. GBA129-24]